MLLIADPRSDFHTGMMTMTKIDRKPCFVTVRLTPEPSVQPLRLELANESAGAAMQRFEASTLKSVSSLTGSDTEREDNVESRKRHFDAICITSVADAGPPAVSDRASRRRSSPSC